MFFFSLEEHIQFDSSSRSHWAEGSEYLSSEPGCPAQGQAGSDRFCWWRNIESFSDSGSLSLTGTVKGWAGEDGLCAGEAQTPGGSWLHHRWRETLGLRRQFQAASQGFYCLQLPPKRFGQKALPLISTWKMRRNCLPKGLGRPMRSGP